MNTKTITTLCMSAAVLCSSTCQVHAQKKLIANRYLFNNRRLLERLACLLKIISTKNICSRIVVMAIFCFGISSCSKNDAIPAVVALIDPADANALSMAVTIPGGNRLSGTMPAATGGLQIPVVKSLVSNVITANGTAAPFLYTYSNITGNPGGYYVQIAGSAYYFNVPYAGGVAANGQVNLPVGLPVNVDAGNFCLLFSIYDQHGHISSPVKVCASVLRLGTGALQVSLAWNTPTDQDLWVTDPSGTKIYYRNKTSATKGQLDRDDVDGYGPENIYWLSDAPDGEYKVQVNDYKYTSTPNTCYVTISAPGKSRSFTVTTQNNNIIQVVTIRKNGSVYDF